MRHTWGPHTTQTHMQDDHPWLLPPLFGVFRDDPGLAPFGGPALPTRALFDAAMEEQRCTSPMPSGMLMMMGPYATDDGDDDVPDTRRHAVMRPVTVRPICELGDVAEVEELPPSVATPTRPKRRVRQRGAETPVAEVASAARCVARDAEVNIYVTGTLSTQPGDVAVVFNLQTTPFATWMRRAKRVPPPSEKQEWSEHMCHLHRAAADFDAVVGSVVRTLRIHGGTAVNVLIYSCSPLLTTAFLVPLLLHTRTDAQAVQFVTPICMAIAHAHAVTAVPQENVLQAVAALHALAKPGATCIVNGCNRAASSTAVPYCAATHLQSCSACGRTTVYPWHKYSLKTAAPAVRTLCGLCAMRHK